MNNRKKIAIVIIAIMILFNLIFVPIHIIEKGIISNDVIEFSHKISFDLITNLGIHESDKIEIKSGNLSFISKEYNYKFVVILNALVVFISYLIFNIVLKDES